MEGPLDPRNFQLESLGKYTDRFWQQMLHKYQCCPPILTCALAETWVVSQEERSEHKNEKEKSEWETIKYSLHS